MQKHPEDGAAEQTCYFFRHLPSGDGRMEISDTWPCDRVSLIIMLLSSGHLVPLENMLASNSQCDAAQNVYDRNHLPG